MPSGKRVSALSAGKRCRPRRVGAKATCTTLLPCAGTSVQAQRHELWLDFTQAGPFDTEKKLSRLCAWVLRADKLGLDYGLRLPALQIKPASGEAHKRQCLEALALC